MMNEQNETLYIIKVDNLYLKRSFSMFTENKNKAKLFTDKKQAAKIARNINGKVEPL